MATSTDLKQRAQTLAAKTDINSIDPQEVGGLFYDLTGYAEDVQRNGGSLGIRKVYASVSAMEADSTSPKDMWGNPMRKGQLCVIYDGTTEGVDNNKVFAFKAPGWEIATQLDAGYATRGELTELEGKTDKIYYHSVFSEDETQPDIKKTANNFVKELWLSDEVAALGSVCIGAIRKNFQQSGQWVIWLYNSLVTSPISVETFTSVNKASSIELIKGAKGSYILVDWSVIEEGNQVGSLSSDYNLNIDYVSDINNFPIIKASLSIISNTANIASNTANINTLAKSVDKIYYHSVFSEDETQPDIKKTANNFVKELWLSDEVAALGTVCLGSIRRNYQGNGAWVVWLFNSSVIGTNAVEEFVSTEKKLGLELIKGKYGSYILIDWTDVKEGYYIGSTSSDYNLNIDYVSDINNFPIIKLSTKKIDTPIDEDYIKKFNVAAISWVDDDFFLSDVPKVKGICDEVGCKCDFGVVPSSQGGTGDYPTDANYYFSEEQLSLMKQYELDGYHMQMHPIHKGWYVSENISSTYQGRAWTEQSLVKTIRLFRENNILNDSCIVYPGDSNKYIDTLNMVKCWLEYGITSSGTYNDGVCDKYNLQRYFIAFSKSKTKSQIKATIDEAVEKGAWIILATHSYQYDDSGTIDETTMSLANLKEVIEYANSKVNIQPISEVFKKRKQMLDLFVE